MCCAACLEHDSGALLCFRLRSVTLGMHPLVVGTAVCMQHRGPPSRAECWSACYTIVGCMHWHWGLASCGKGAAGDERWLVNHATMFG